MTSGDVSTKASSTDTFESSHPTTEEKRTLFESTLINGDIKTAVSMLKANYEDFRQTYDQTFFDKVKVAIDIYTGRVEAKNYTDNENPMVAKSATQFLDKSELFYATNKNYSTTELLTIAQDNHNPDRQYAIETLIFRVERKDLEKAATAQGASIQNDAIAALGTLAKDSNIAYQALHDIAVAGDDTWRAEQAIVQLSELAFVREDALETIEGLAALIQDEDYSMSKRAEMALTAMLGSASRDDRMATSLISLLKDYDLDTEVILFSIDKLKHSLHSKPIQDGLKTLLLSDQKSEVHINILNLIVNQNPRSEATDAFLFDLSMNHSDAQIRYKALQAIQTAPDN